MSNHGKNIHSYPIHNINKIYECSGKGRYVNALGRMVDNCSFCFPSSIKQYDSFPTFMGPSIYSPSQQTLTNFYKIFLGYKDFHVCPISNLNKQNNLRNLKEFKSIYIYAPIDYNKVDLLLNYALVDYNELDLLSNNVPNTINTLMSHTYGILSLHKRNS